MLHKKYLLLILTLLLISSSRVCFAQNDYGKVGINGRRFFFDSTLFAPNTANLYSVKVTDQMGCSKTVSISAPMCCNQEIDATPHFFSNVINNGTATAMINHFQMGSIISTIDPIVIDGDFIVNANLNLSGCPNVFMHPDAKIIVNNGVTFTLSYNNSNNRETKISSDCDKMWWGINSIGTGIVQINGNVNGTANSSINGVTIKDMINGINLQNNSVINCLKANFINNYVGISLSNTPTNYSGEINRCLFKTDASFLLFPYAGQIGRYGIRAYNCNSLNIGSSSLGGNTFDNLKTGVYFGLGQSGFVGTQATCKIHNCIFNNITGGNYGIPAQLNSSPTTLFNDQVGTAIFGENNSVNPFISNVSLIVDHLSSSPVTNFNNCTKGITTSGMATNVNHIKMSNLIWGVNLSSKSSYVFQVNYNTLTDIRYGINFSGDIYAATISNNSISSTSTGYTVFNGMPLIGNTGIKA